MEIKNTKYKRIAMHILQDSVAYKRLFGNI